MALTSLRNLLVEQMRDLYSAENQLVKALPKMAQAASNEALREAFQEHLDETRGHVERLQKAFKELSESPEGEHCEAMEGLIKEGEQVINKQGESHVKDAALIASAQRVEHYEIAGYGTVHAFADELDLDNVADLMGETLGEEEAADKKLNKIAVGGMLASGLNKEAEKATAG